MSRQRSSMFCLRKISRFERFCDAGRTLDLRIPLFSRLAEAFLSTFFSLKECLLIFSCGEVEQRGPETTRGQTDVVCVAISRMHRIHRDRESEDRA